MKKIDTIEEYNAVMDLHRSTDDPKVEEKLNGLLARYLKQGVTDRS